MAEPGWDGIAAHNPEKLLELGSRCSERLITAVKFGLRKDVPIDYMTMTIYNSIPDQEPAVIAAMITSCVISMAKGR